MKLVRALTIIALIAMACVFAPLSASAQTRPFSTGFQVQNLSGTTANVSISFYPENNGTPLPPVAVTPPVPPNGSTTYATLPSAVSAGFTGSAVISSDQKVAAIVNVVSPDLSLSFGGASYVGFSGGSKSVSLPIMFKNYFGFNTFFNVQNVSTTNATNVVVTYSGGGLASPLAMPALSIPAGAARRVDQATVAGLPASFSGSAVVTSDQDIAASVVQVGPTTMLSYNGFNAGSNDLVFPLVNANNGGFVTGINIQNVGTAATAVTVSYTPSSAGTACTETLSIAPKAVATFALNAFASTVGGETCANAPTTFVGSAKVTANTGSQPLVGVVNQLNSGTNKAGSYDGFSAASATNIVVYPLMQDRFFGYFTGFSIANVGTVATPVTCTFSGSPVTQSIPALAVGATFTAVQNNVIANSYNGSATCTASAAGAKIVGIANQIKTTGTADTFFVYEGTNN